MFTDVWLFDQLLGPEGQPANPQLVEKWLAQLKMAHKLELSNGRIVNLKLSNYFIHADRLLEMRNGQLSELTGEERDAASRDAVDRTAKYYDADLADCCRQVNMIKIPKLLISI